jgi:hypothetical protein
LGRRGEAVKENKGDLGAGGTERTQDARGTGLSEEAEVKQGRKRQGHIDCGMQQSLESWAREF